MNKKFVWLKEVDSIAIQSSTRNLSDAYKRFFIQQNDHLYFKSKKNPIQSYTTKQTNENMDVMGNKIKLPKLGLIRFAKNCEVDGRIVRATVSRNPNGKYFVSLLVGTEVQALPKTNSSVCIDIGLKVFATLSNGLPYEELTTAQRILF